MDDAEANHFCQKEHDIKHFRVLSMDKISGDEIHRERKLNSLCGLKNVQLLNRKDLIQNIVLL